MGLWAWDGLVANRARCIATWVVISWPAFTKEVKISCKAYYSSNNRKLAKKSAHFASTTLRNKRKREAIAVLGNNRTFHRG
jgi:hypothetical protein